MKVYFDRIAPLYLSNASSFDGVEVQVKQELVDFVVGLRGLIEQVERDIYEVGSPQNGNQALADTFATELAILLEAVSNGDE